MNKPEIHPDGADIDMSEDCEARERIDQRATMVLIVKEKKAGTQPRQHDRNGYTQKQYNRDDLIKLPVFIRPGRLVKFFEAKSARRYAGDTSAATRRASRHASLL